MYWIIIAILVVVAFFILRIHHLKHKIFLFLVVFAVLFIFITASNVVTKYKIDLKSVNGIEKGAKIYFAWLGGAFDNFKSITGNAIKMDWRFENKTSEAIKVSEKK